MFVPPNNARPRRVVSYRELPNGLYLGLQQSPGKILNHRGVIDIGNRTGLPGSDGEPKVFHQTPPRARVDRLCDTGPWFLLGRITNEKAAIKRMRLAFSKPTYNVFLRNCEQFSSYIATGVAESPQLRAGVLAGLAALMLAAQRPKRSRRRNQH